MKENLFLILLYVGQAIGFYLLTALIGMIWADSWRELIHNDGFNTMYWLFIGWWIPAPACAAYYKEHIKN